MHRSEAERYAVPYEFVCGVARKEGIGQAGRAPRRRGVFAPHGGSLRVKPCLVRALIAVMDVAFGAPSPGTFAGGSYENRWPANIRDPSNTDRWWVTFRIDGPAIGRTAGVRHLVRDSKSYASAMANRPNERIARAMHLASEISTATEHLALGLNQAASPAWQARQPGAAFTQLSQGVERLLKVTYLLSEESAGRAVDPKFGAGAGGHAITDLNTRVLSTLAAASESAVPYLRELLADTMNDPYWKDVLIALDAWAATSGRYGDLDALRGKESRVDPAWAPWEEAERRAIAEGGWWGNLSDDALAASRLLVLRSVMRWWHTLYRCWQHGLVGADGKAFASGVSPQNLHLNSELAELVARR